MELQIVIEHMPACPWDTGMCFFLSVKGITALFIRQEATLNFQFRWRWGGMGMMSLIS